MNKNIINNNNNNKDNKNIINSDYMNDLGPSIFACFGRSFDCQHKMSGKIHLTSSIIGGVHTMTANKANTRQKVPISLALVEKVNE